MSMGITRRTGVERLLQDISRPYFAKLLQDAHIYYIVERGFSSGGYSKGKIRCGKVTAASSLRTSDSAYFTYASAATAAWASSRERKWIFDRGSSMLILARVGANRPGMGAGDQIHQPGV